MGEYLFKSMQEKKKLSESQRQNVSNGTGILDMAARIGNQAMLSILERPMPEGKQPLIGLSNGSSLPKYMQQALERQSGFPMDDVRVHRDSKEPAKFDADAFAYGNHIFLGPGQEELLSHELGHTIQQKRGIVQPQGTEHGFPVNNDPSLEKKADDGNVCGSPLTNSTVPVVQCGGGKDTQKKDGKGNPRAKYGDGTYGAKLRDLKRLKEKYGQKDGMKDITKEINKKVQAEHTISFSALNNSGRPRKKMGQFDRSLFSYHESTSAHGAHPGTRWGRTEDSTYDSDGKWQSGFTFGFQTDREYRDHQYNAVTDTPASNGVGNAVQLNQLGYAQTYQHNKTFDSNLKMLAHDSFFHMAKNMSGKELEYYEKGTHELKKRTITPEEAAEMSLARLTMSCGSYPNIDVENRVRRIFNLPEIRSDNWPSSYRRSSEDDLKQQRMNRLLDIMLG